MCCGDKFFDLLDTKLTMFFDDQPEASLEVIDVSHADGFSDQA